MMITNISNAILRNTQNLAKASILGGFAYGFIQTMRTGESALKVPTSKLLSFGHLSSQQRREEEEGSSSLQPATATAPVKMEQKEQTTATTDRGVKSTDIERRRVNAAVAWSSMR